MVFSSAAGDLAVGGSEADPSLALSEDGGRVEARRTCPGKATLNARLRKGSAVGTRTGRRDPPKHLLYPRVNIVTGILNTHANTILNCRYDYQQTSWRASSLHTHGALVQHVLVELVQLVPPHLMYLFAEFKRAVAARRFTRAATIVGRSYLCAADLPDTNTTEVVSFCTVALLRPNSLVTSPREVSTILTSELIPSRNEGVGVRWRGVGWR